MTLYRDEAVVLRLHKLGEADRIVTLLTRRHGRVRAVAKGVRRTTSRFGGRLEPFNHVDAQFYTGRSDLDIVTQVEVVTPYGAELAAHYPRYTAGTAILEATERLAAADGEPSLRLYLVLLGAVRALAEGAHEPGLVLDAFVLRGLAVSGWEPSLRECARCGTCGEHRWFSPAAGGAVCGGCRPAGAATAPPEALLLLRALLTGDWTVADGAPQPVRRAASGLVVAYLQWHLERGLRSLPMVERA